ncbi:MAG: GH3 auxin-responsive promoter family protein, partial [Flavobacteriaceae bacterium]
IKHFISAFGEHVIAKEVEYAMQQAIAQTDARVLEFTVAPQASPASGLPYHEWLVAFEKEPTDMDVFTSVLDQQLQEQNSYYKDLIVGKVLRALKLTTLPAHAFTDYMKTKGKLGGQNKVQRLANDRQIADALLKIKADAS